MTDLDKVSLDFLATIAAAPNPVDMTASTNTASKAMARRFIASDLLYGPMSRITITNKGRSVLASNRWTT